jgi:hypothetical protein
MPGGLFIEKSITIKVEKEEIVNLRESEDAPQPGIKGYEAKTEKERALDKSLNFKLDSIVVAICVINFLV